MIASIDLPRRIANESTGDRIEFLSSPLLGEGDTLVFRCTLPPGATGAPLHVHDRMHEIFEVESGALEIDYGRGRRRLIGPGERIEIAPGVRHGFRNPLECEARFVSVASPGEGLESFLRTVYAMGSAGSSDGPSLPNDPRVMALALRHADLVFAGVPRPLYRMLVNLLAWLGERAGLGRSMPGRGLEHRAAA